MGEATAHNDCFVRIEKQKKKKRNTGAADNVLFQIKANTSGRNENSQTKVNNRDENRAT